MKEHVRECVPSAIEAEQEEQKKQEQALKSFSEQEIGVLEKVYIYEKDSKKVHIYDIRNVSVKTVNLPIEASFPHNY